MEDLKKSQKEQILDYLSRHGSISSRDAVIDLGVMRLASRISELKKDGYDIVGSTEKGKNRNGRTVHYSVYTFRN